MQDLSADEIARQIEEGRKGFGVSFIETNEQLAAEQHHGSCPSIKDSPCPILVQISDKATADATNDPGFCNHLHDSPRRHAAL